jgi:hypothetical protein
MEFGGDNAYRQAPGLTMTDVPDGVVVADTEGAALHVLNPTAAAVLILCDGNQNLQSIARLLQEEFSLADIPLQDVRGCVEQLLQLGLISPADGTE